MEYDKSLTAKLLPAPLIVKNFVVGEKDCNYEIYLREFLNSSVWFREKVNCDFIASISESKGECDAYAGEYGIDFKLIGSRTAIQSRSILSENIMKFSKGVIAYGPPKDNTSMTIYRIHAILRNRTLDELKIIRNVEKRIQDEETEIKTFLKTLEAKKHLLLFFPYEFSFAKKYDLVSGATQIQNALNGDFKNAILYRYDKTARFETYMSFIYNNTFFIMEWRDDKFEIIDNIPTTSSKTYTKLKDYSSEL